MSNVTLDVWFVVSVISGIIYLAYRADKRDEQKRYEEDMLWEKEAFKETAVLTIYRKDGFVSEIKRKAYQTMPGNELNCRVNAEDAARNFLKHCYERGYVKYNINGGSYIYPTSEIIRAEIKLIKGQY